MIHEKWRRNLEDHQFTFKNKLQRNLWSSLAVSPWLNKHPMPKLSGHKRERPVPFLTDFEHFISAIDVNTNKISVEMVVSPSILI